MCRGIRCRKVESAMHPDLNRVDLRPHPDHDPPPELYTIDGAVPPEVLEARVEWLRRNPAHPGDELTGILERFELEIPEAAARLGVESADLAAVLEGREPVTVDLAMRLEAAGWDTAEGWMHWQVDYDIAQERRKRAREAESIDPTTETAPRASAALTLPA